LVFNQGRNLQGVVEAGSRRGPGGREQFPFNIAAVTYLLRSWTDRDAGGDREISRAIYPEYREEPRHPAWFPAQQLGAPREYASRYVAESQKGECVAYATLWELRPTRYRFDLAVRPESQQQGIATQLLAQVISDAHAFGATGLQARVRDDKTNALDFVRRRGFHEVHRMGAYRLDFDQADTSGFQDAFVRLRDRGIEVTNLAAVRKLNPQYLEQFYELYSVAREGWPDPDPDPNGPVPIPFEQVKHWLDEAQLPEAFFIAKQAHRNVAFTSFFNIGTAVHPEYRGKGIAALLKAGSIADAQRRGFQGQTTSTASPAMQKVLEKLGYRRIWSEIRLIRPMA
jgi:GNAT superfamily N-acetyltransferase